MTVTVTNSTEKTVKKIKVLGRTFCSKLDGRAFQAPVATFPGVSHLVSQALLGPWNLPSVSVVRAAGP